MARATRWGRIAGTVLAAALAAWIWLVIQPDPELVLGGWAATILAAWWIGGRVAREIVYGAQRFTNRGAREATPPRVAPDTDEDEEKR
jgi:hypothetical protein